ncbi:MAG: N-acetylmuramoyl-L-alanine amidase [Dehalococcoidia bacterium]|nr:MAG: N-acetylmuramoyl-L-alanine amidase [Dehalococcoidia bacterium]
MFDVWCPFAVAHPSGPFGYPAGTRGQNRPLFFVDHRMAGWKRTLDDDAWRGANGVGVHFGIGLDGAVSQYASIFDASWGNGVTGSVERYDRRNRHLAAIERLGSWRAVSAGGVRVYALVDRAGVNVVNAHSISFEHEDGGRAGVEWPSAMLAADVAVKAWCVEQLAAAGMPMTVDGDALAGHFQIDPVNRPDCPGATWPRREILERLSGVTGGSEMWVRLNGTASWWSGRRLGPVAAGTMRLDVDFPELPETARAVDLEVFLDPASRGALVLRDGDGAYAGQVNARRMQSVIRAVPRDRQIRFDVTGDITIELIGVVGYLT